MKKLLPTFFHCTGIFCWLSAFFFFTNTATAQSCCPRFKLSIPENCERPDSLCIATGPQGAAKVSACKNTTNTYSVYPDLPGYTYTWTVVGGTPLTFTGNPITVTWGNGGNAALKVVVQQIAGNCKDSFIVELCLKDGPKANFNIPDTVCANQPVNFMNTSVGGAAYTWNFGDGSSFNGPNPPAHYYSTPGTYVVSLFVTNNPNAGTQPVAFDCFCRDIYYDTITVINGTGPIIDTVGCYSTLCATDTPLITMYSTPTVCGSYSWSVVGGTITSGQNTPNITVQWNPTFGGTPSVTLTVPASCAGGCAASTTIQVPIIYPNLPIQGPNPVCVSSNNTYTLPTLPGCYYTWSISGAGFFTSSTNTYNSPSVSVMASMSPGTYTLTCVYFDSLKMCGGTSTRTITVLPKFAITKASSKVCENSVGFYQANGNASWQVFQNGVLVPSYVIPNGSNCTINWLLPGTYQVVATSLNPATYCNSTYSATVVVVERPVITAISALSSTICPGDLMQYFVTSNKPDYPYTWTCTGGTILANDDDNVTVLWGNTGGTLSVLQNNPDPNLICPSNTITFTAIPYALPTITGPATACEDDVVNYTAAPTGLPDYQWTIVGGSIMSGQGTASVQVKWAGGSGAHVLTLTTCSGTANQTVTVTNKVSFPVSFNAGAGCTYTLTSSVVAPSYNWYHNGTLLVGNTQTINITASGYYTCLPNLPCTKASGINVTIPAAPVVTISTPHNLYCLAGTNSVPAINFTSAISAGGSYTYQWYHNPSPGLIPAATSPNYTQPAGPPAASVGSYYLVVSYGNGCTATSNTIVIDTGCGSGVVCPLPPAPYTMSIATTCGTNFMESFSSPPPTGTFVSWNFGDGFSGTSAVGAGISHNYAFPGIYNVCATASNNTYCDVIACTLDTVPIAPSFSVNVNCGAATCTNTSQTLSGIGPYTIAWSATGGTVSPSSGPTTTFVGNGTVTMTITYNGCTYVSTQNVNTPTTSVAINNPASACVADPNINAFSTTPSGYAVYTWAFGDLGTSGISPTSHAYNSPGTYNITVTVVDYNGCTTTANSSILIHPLPTVNLVTSDTFICVGSTATLTATPGMTNYAWYKGNTLITSGPSNTLVINSFGMYTVVATDVNGCINRSNKIPCIVKPLPKFKINFVDPFSSILCVNASQAGYTNVQATYNPNYTYSWTAAPPISISLPTSHNTGISVPVSTPAGNYSLYLTVTDTTTGCSKSDSVCLTVSLAPNVNIAPGASICAGIPTLLTPTPNNSTLYHYYWNNGVTTPTNTVSAAGAYSVSITDKQSGCTATSNIVVVNRLPNVSLYPTGCDTLCDTAHLYIPLPNVVNQVAPATQYPTIDWYVDGSYNSSGPFLALNTLTPGSHLVHVIVFNNFGCSSQTGDFNIFVKQCEDTCTVKALFTYNLHNDTVQFENASTGNGQLHYYWTFGDGDTSHMPNPIHHYDSSAVYTVCLYVTNILNGDTCRDSLCMCICICEHDSSCNEFLGYLQHQGISVNGVGNPTIIFSPPTLLPTDIVRWDFTCDGIIDLVTMGNATATYTYLSSGSYVACAKIERIIGGDTCWARLTTLVKVSVKQNCVCDTSFDGHVNAGFATSVSGNTVTFVPLALTNCDTVEWNFGDGSPIVYSVGNATVSHTYANPNIQYYVCMLVKRAGSTKCYRENCKYITVSGIDEMLLSNVQVYPNPTKDVLMVASTDQLPDGAQLLLRDITGRIVLSQSSVMGARIQYIDMSTLSSGVYSIAITNANGKSLLQQRVVKY